MRVGFREQCEAVREREVLYAPICGAGLLSWRTPPERNARTVDVDLERLWALRSLVEVDLCGTAVTDEGFLSLARLNALRVVNVYGTVVSEGAVRAFVALRPDVRVTREDPIGPVSAGSP
jgi:hypothetical protein